MLLQSARNIQNIHFDSKVFVLSFFVVENLYICLICPMV